MPMTFRSTNTSCYFQWRRIGFESPYSTCDVLKEKEMQIRSNQTNKDKIHNGSIFIEGPVDTGKINASMEKNLKIEN